MRLTARTDVEAPQAVVFDRLSHIPTIEALARERGAEVARLDDGTRGTAGAAWRLSVPLHGRARAATARVAAFDPADRIAVAADLEGVEAWLDLALAPLAPARTALSTELRLRPRTMTARLLVQPLRLARAQLEQRLRARIDAIARRIEAGEA